MPFYVPTNVPRKITNLKSSFGSPKWFDAVYNADIEYIKKHSKNINKKDDLGYTALHHASIAGNVEVVSLLLDQGEEVTVQGQDGATPLRCAVQEGHAGVVAILLAKGAALEEKDEDDLTLLHCAADAGHEPIARLLLCKAPHLANIQSRSGWTPLHSASVMGHAHIVKLLTEYSANIRLLNNQGKTCLDLAKDRNKTEVLTILERTDSQAQRSQPAAGHQQLQPLSEEQEQLETAGQAAAAHSSDGSKDDSKETYERKGMFRHSVVRRVLECPVCLEQMNKKKIIQCLNGHNVCGVCRNQLTSCPQCRIEYSSQDIRNRGLEDLANGSIDP